MLNAATTNAISNGLHASALLLYFLGALYHYLKKDPHFPLLVILAFLTLFVLKVLGVYVHYSASHSDIIPSWIAISLSAIMLNYLIVQALDMPDPMRALCMFLFLIFSYLFIVDSDGGRNFLFIYIAIPSLFVYLVAAFYSASLLRTGFLMIVFSNIIWIATRHIENSILGHEIPVAYRYDNDLYHLLLIISTFIIYKATVKTGWRNWR